MEIPSMSLIKMETVSVCGRLNYYYQRSLQRSAAG